MPDLRAQAALYAHTLRHLKPIQVWGRLWAMAKRRMAIQLPDVPPALQAHTEKRAPFLQHDPGNSREQLRAGTFRFLNRRADLGWPPAWPAEEMPLLWRFYLHYFAYLHLLTSDEQRTLCLDWVQRHLPDASVAWHPFPTSLRIAHWCKAGLEEPRLLQSLYQQTAYLHRNTEFYLLGNHYLENARALVLAGCYFGEQGEALQWLAHGLRIYREQTPEQILADGGHFERSPMYHALMLEGYLDVLNVLPAAHRDRPWLEDAARRMADFLRSVTHPDGQISLFNDATQEVAPPTARLVEYAAALLDYQAAKQPMFPQTGYYIHEDEDVYLIIDGGPVGPDYLPAHAHADVFSYELSVGGRPLVVDSGVQDYTPGAIRTHMRSTKAHNTVCIDGLDQVECWGCFRVARRSAPSDVRFRQQNGTSVFSGTFGGYGKLLGDGIVHRREIRWEDQRLTVADVVEGAGRHLVESRVHLHPDVRLERNGDQVVLTQQEIRCVFRTEGPVALERGWYSPEFGKRIETDVLVLRSDRPLPARFSYTILIQSLQKAEPSQRTRSDQESTSIG